MKTKFKFKEFCVLCWKYLTHPSLLFPPQTASSKTAGFFVYCRISNKFFSFNEVGVRIENFNGLKKTLVVDCPCGDIHYHDLPYFALQDSVREQQKKDLAKHNFKTYPQKT